MWHYLIHIMCCISPVHCHWPEQVLMQCSVVLDNLLDAQEQAWHQAQAGVPPAVQGMRQSLHILGEQGNLASLVILCYGGKPHQADNLQYSQSHNTCCQPLTSDCGLLLVLPCNPHSGCYSAMQSGPSHQGCECFWSPRLLLLHLYSTHSLQYTFSTQALSPAFGSFLVCHSSVPNPPCNIQCSTPSCELWFQLTCMWSNTRLNCADLLVIRTSSAGKARLALKLL